MITDGRGFTSDFLNTKSKTPRTLPPVPLKQLLRVRTSLLRFSERRQSVPQVILRLLGGSRVTLKVNATSHARIRIRTLGEIENTRHLEGTDREIIAPRIVLWMGADGRAARMQRRRISNFLVRVSGNNIESGFGTRINSYLDLGTLLTKEVTEGCAARRR